MLSTDEIIKEFTDELTKATRFVMVNAGVDKNSDLVKSVRWEQQAEGVFIMLANDYYEYVSTGRKPRARKVPIFALVQWIKNIKLKGRNKKTGRFISDNSLAFAIQASIFKHGIKGKNYITEVDNIVGDITELKLAEGLEDALAKEIDKTFK